MIKKGEHGAMLFSEGGVFIVPAYPLDAFEDPTGAGDTFAGGLLGSLARTGDRSQAGLRNAMIAGSVIASFGVERFSLDRLQSLTESELNDRTAAFREMITIA